MASPTPGTSSSSAGMAHPEMAYAPVPASDQGDGSGDLPSGKPFKWYFSPMVFIRLTVLGVVIAGITVEALCFRDPAGLFALGMFIQSSVLAWNTVVLAYTLVKFIKTTGGRCPSMIIQVGSCRLSCGDEEDDGEEGHSLMETGATRRASTPKRRRMLVWIGQVYDASLAIMLLCGVLAEAVNQSNRRQYYWWNTYHRDAMLGLMLTMMCLQIILALLPYTKFTKTIACFAYADDSDENENVTYQIRLPQDPRSSKATRDVSITA